MKNLPIKIVLQSAYKRNNFWDDQLNIWPNELILKSENTKFLTPQHQYISQDIF